MDAKNPKAKSATLSAGSEKWDLTVRDGSIWPSVVDISNLYADTGKFMDRKSDDRPFKGVRKEK